MVNGVVGTGNLGPNNRYLREHFSPSFVNSRPIHVCVCALGGDLRYQSVYYPTNLTLNLVRFGVDRTFEIMMHR